MADGIDAGARLGHRLDMDGIHVRYGQTLAVRDDVAAAFVLLLVMDRAVGLTPRMSV